MAVRRHKSGHLAMVAAVLGLVALGIGGPIVGSDGERLDLAGGTLVAAPRDKYAITEPLTLQGVPGIRIERGVISLSERYVGKGLTGEAALALITGGSARLVLEGAILVLDRSASGQSELAADPVAPLASAVAELGFESLSIRRSTLVFRGAGGSIETIGDLTAEVLTKRKSSVSAKGTVVVRGHKLTFDTVLGLVADKRGGPTAARQQPLKVHVKSSMLEASIDGRLASGDSLSLQGQGEVAVRNVREGARWIGLGWPTGPGLADLKIKGPIEWNSQVLAFQRAAITMDGNEALGTVSLAINGGRPNVSATLSLQTFDLSRYVASWRNEASRSILEDVMGPGPFALPLVRHLDADIRISANRVRTGGPEFGQSAATLSLKNGKLLADVAEIAYDDARMTGQLMVDTNPAMPRYMVRGKLQGADLARLIPDQAGVAPIRGKGDLVADLSASGEATSDLLRTLSGKLSFAMPSGGRVGLDLKAMLSAAQKQPLTGWGGSGRGTTTVDSLQGRLVMSEGVVYTESFSAALGDAHVTATGGGSLRSGLVDLRVSMAGRTAQVDPQTVEALVLRGPWNEPSIRAERVPAANPISEPAQRPQ